MVWHQAFWRLFHSLAVIFMLLIECCGLLLFFNLSNELLSQVLIRQLRYWHLQELVNMLLCSISCRLKRVNTYTFEGLALILIRFVFGYEKAILILHLLLSILLRPIKHSRRIVKLISLTHTWTLFHEWQLHLVICGWLWLHCLLFFHELEVEFWFGFATWFLHKCSNLLSI